MKLIRFTAEKVHNYMDFNINFFQDLNFLAGLNGTGKTTVLNLIIALVTPSLKKLATIDFKMIEIKFNHENEISTIKCIKDKEMLYLYFNDIESSINLKGIRFDYEEDLIYELKSKNIFEEIQKIPTPMFLDLNRRFIKNSRLDIRKRNREYHLNNRRIIEEEESDLSLEEVKELISKTINSITIKELRISEVLKKNILKDSFTIHSINYEDDLTIPTIQQVKEYKETILSTLTKLELIDDSTIFEDFFLSMEKIIRNLDSYNMKNNKSKKIPSKDEMEAISNWIVNQPQLYRVIRLSEQINTHQKHMKNLNNTKNNFLDAVNRFFNETGKELLIKDNGKIEISILGINRDINFLASGERQILIMLCHLYLNKELPKNGVFIVDEPELSLHLLWQEKFVDEIIKAKPDLQIILATHSPAIIQNKQEKYVPLYE